MTIKFIAVSTNITINGNVLAEGVRGVTCLEGRKTTFGERMDYIPFLPLGCGLSSVEVYANGARNFYVKNEDDKTVGYLIIRPNFPEVSDKDFDEQMDRINGNYDMD